MELAKEIYMYILGAIIIILAFFLSYLLIFYEVPAANRAILEVAFGLVLGWGGAIVGYFFGTSKSSAAKDQTIKTMTIDKAKSDV